MARKALHWVVISAIACYSRRARSANVTNFESNLVHQDNLPPSMARPQRSLIHSSQLPATEHKNPKSSQNTSSIDIHASKSLTSLRVLRIGFFLLTL